MSTRITQRRLMNDIKIIKKDPNEYIDVVVIDDNLFEWYFLVKGPEYSIYNGGYYIGKIMLPKEYPMKPPDFMMLTPSGRFLINKKICLSNSGYHSNEWSSMWTIQKILIGFLSIMVSDDDQGISHIHRPKEERIKLAKESIEYNREHHKDIIKLFTRFLDQDGYPKLEEKQSTTKPKNAKKKNKKINDKSNDKQNAKPNNKLNKPNDD